MQSKTSKSLGVFALAMLITGSIDSIRNLPATALFGTTLVFFLVLAAVLFLIPAALISAQLSSAYPEKGGIYNWVKMAFGKRPAVIAIWLQWINTMVWFPTILSFVAGTIAYVINPQLAANKTFLVMVILSIFWMMTLVNLKGLHASARLASVCAVVGMIIPMVLIITLGLLWVLTGKPIAIHFNTHDVLPTFSHTGSFVSLTAIMTAFLGMELATVHMRQVKNAQRVFPKALMTAVTIILMTMLLGSLAIAWLLPYNKINLVDGVMQAFGQFFAAYHLQWLVPVLGVMLLIGSLGGMINWLISPAKGLLQAAQDGFLPKFLAHENKHHVPQNLLIIQALVVTMMSVAFLLMPSVNGSYWLLSDLSTELYMLMYVLMFAAAIKLAKPVQSLQATFQIPFGKMGWMGMALLGLLGCVVTLLVGFLPPENMDVGGVVHYVTVFSIGLIVMIIPAGLMMRERVRI